MWRLLVYFFLLCTSWQTLTRGLWICKTGHLKCTLLFLRVCRHRDDRCGSGMRCLQRMKPAWRARRGKRTVRWAGSVTETHRWIWIIWKHEIRFESLWVHVRLLCAPFKSGLTREDLFLEQWVHYSPHLDGQNIVIWRKRRAVSSHHRAVVCITWKCFIFNQTCRISLRKKCKTKTGTHCGGNNILINSYFKAVLKEKYVHVNVMLNIWCFHSVTC